MVSQYVGWRTRLKNSAMLKVGPLVTQDGRYYRYQLVSNNTDLYWFNTHSRNMSAAVFVLRLSSTSRNRSCISLVVLPCLNRDICNKLPILHICRYESLCSGMIHRSKVFLMLFDNQRSLTVEDFHPQLPGSLNLYRRLWNIDRSKHGSSGLNKVNTDSYWFY